MSALRQTPQQECQGAHRVVSWQQGGAAAEELLGTAAEMT